MQLLRCLLAFWCDEFTNQNLVLTWKWTNLIEYIKPIQRIFYNKKKQKTHKLSSKSKIIRTSRKFICMISSFRSQKRVFTCHFDNSFYAEKSSWKMDKNVIKKKKNGKNSLRLSPNNAKCNTWMARATGLRLLNLCQKLRWKTNNIIGAILKTLRPIKEIRMNIECLIIDWKWS